MKLTGCVRKGESTKTVVCFSIPQHRLVSNVDIRDYLTAIFAMMLMSTHAAAIPLAEEYSITASATQVGVDSYVFRYDVTNNNQQVGSTQTGLDGFYVQVPNSATVSNITDPPPYFGGNGFWDHGYHSGGQIFNAPEAPLNNGYSWLWWWGRDSSSVYPIGSTAQFSFQADAVGVGTASAVSVTFWGTNTPLSPCVDPVDPWGWCYSAFSTDLISPIATSGLLGDMDIDGDVDFDDIDDFVLGLNSEPNYFALYGMSPAVHGDMNQDGVQDFDDIAPFVGLLNAGIHAVPEPATGTLAFLLGGVLLMASGATVVRVNPRTAFAFLSAPMSNWRDLGSYLRTISCLSAAAVLLLTACNEVLAVPIFNPSNAHYYELIDMGVDWSSADSAATALTHKGLTGHLVTITDAQENNFLTATFGAGALHLHWIGGLQPIGSAEPGGGWSWVTGEEFVFNNWWPGEPNNFGGFEDRIVFDHGTTIAGKSWNDLDGLTNVDGYVVEFDGEPVPEPATLSLLCMGALVLSGMVKTRRQWLPGGGRGSFQRPGGLFSATADARCPHEDGPD